MFHRKYPFDTKASSNEKRDTHETENKVVNVYQ